MSLTPTSDRSHELHGNHVLLRADTLRLLLPQDEVGAALYLDAVPQPSGVPGVFEHHGAGVDQGGQPLVALSKRMLPLDKYPQDRFVVTTIATPLGDVGFGWSEVSVLIDQRLHTHPVPAALTTPDSPLRTFVEIDDQVVFCCSAAQLADFALSSGA